MFEQLFSCYSHLGSQDELHKDVVPLFNRPRQLVEEPMAENAKVWEEFFKTRGATRKRDRRRLEYALCDTLSRIHLNDWSVVRVLNQLASRAPSSQIQSDILARTASILQHKKDFPREREIPDELLEPLMSLKVDPRVYTDSNQYFWDNQLVKLLSKYPFAGYDEVGEANAVTLFLECENLNTLTNDRWRTLAPSDGIERVADRLDDILGIPPSVEEVMSSGGWGPGVVEDYNFSTKETGPEFKFAAMPSLTPNLIPIATRILETVPAWDASLRGIYGRHERFVVVEGSTLFTVPKKFKMKRCALKEPMLNAWMQSGLGSIMRRRFTQSTGVDLRWSWSVNQELARIGSLTGIFCTVDLQSASDSVCRGPLKSIAHPGWFGLWEACASDSCELPPNASELLPQGILRHRFQMMSSMGNGFTFELESILFYAIVTSIVPGIWTPNIQGGGKRVLTWPHVSVFGDDLVFPAAYYDQVVQMLTEFGFTVNKDKSFKEGPFRESCGKDYFLGVDTRPLYITKRLDNGSSVITLANRLYASAHLANQGSGRLHGFGSDRWAGAWTAVLAVIPPWLRRLLATPPHVESGIWGLPGTKKEASWETAEGQPRRWKVISQVPVKFNLRYGVLQLPDPVNHAHSGIWVSRLNGENLMAARLSQSSHKENVIERFMHANMRTSGAWATLRDAVTYKVNTESITERSLWLGFANLK